MTDTQHTPETLEALSKRWLKNLSPQEQALVLEFRKQAKRARHRRANQVYAAKHPDRVKARRQRWESENAEYRREYNKKWKAENPERHAASQKAWFEQPSNRMRSLITSRISDCKRRGILFDAAALWVLADNPPTHCAFCGIELNYEFGDGPRQDGPSIDKVIPERGYVSGNIAVLCRLHNTMKGNATADEHRALADFMDRYK